MRKRRRRCPYLRPDGKSQVTVEYEHGKPVRVDTVVISTQHDADVSQEQIAADDHRARDQRRSSRRDLLDEKTKYFINPTGRFVDRRADGRRRA